MEAPRTLPDGWRLHWVEAGRSPPASARNVLRGGDADTVTGVALALHRHGLSAFGGGSFPLRASEVALPAFPFLDDVVTLWAFARRERGDEVRHLEPLARYAEDVRQGRWPDAQPVERALQSIYLAMAQHLLLREAPERDGFLAEAFGLLDHVAHRLDAGSRLGDDDLVSDVPSLRRYVSLLEKDRDHYAEDRRRAVRLCATVPGSATWTGAAREVALLAIERPSATQFKLWARRDPAAPGGKGYALLVVKHASGWALVSADPDQKVRVGWLGEALTAAERAARAAGAGAGAGAADAAWCGTRYEGTVCESPPDGTRLGIDGIVAALRVPLALRREPSPARVRRIATAAGMVAAGALAMALGAGLGGNDRGGGVRGVTVAPPGAGEPPAAEIAPPDDAIVAARVDRALVIGGDDYRHWPTLHNAERDAAAVADELERRFGFRVERRMRPTSDEFVALVTKYATMDYGPADQLLVYVAGHGFFDPVRRQGYLIFRDSAPSFDPKHANSFDLDSLRKAFEGARAPHVLLVIDTCFSGTIDDAVARRSGTTFEQSVRLRDHLRSRSRLVIASAGKRETPDGEPGSHSPFAAALLDVLRRPPDERGFLSFLDVMAGLGALTPMPYYGKFGDEAERAFASFVLQWRSPAAAPVSEGRGRSP